MAVPTATPTPLAAAACLMGYPLDAVTAPTISAVSVAVESRELVISRTNKASRLFVM